MSKRDKATSPVEPLKWHKMCCFQGGQTQNSSWIGVLALEVIRLIRRGCCIPANVYKGFTQLCRVLVAGRKL